MSTPVQPTVSPSAPQPTSPPSPQPPCATGKGKFIPARLTMSALGIDLPVTAEGLTDEGAFPAPANNAKWQTSWWKDGARPGSGKGVAHFGVHTYADGGKHASSGNVLGNYARVGQLIKLYDKHGVVRACYQVTAIKTWSKDRVPIGKHCSAKDSVCRLKGAPGLAIEFCWDKRSNWGVMPLSERWDERRYVEAKQVK